MRKPTITFLALAAILLAGSLTFKADAQTSRGAAAIPAQAQNFTAIEKAACGRSGAAGAGRSTTAFAATADAGARTADRDRILAPNGAMNLPEAAFTGGLGRFGLPRLS